jgi:hypothetical protein
MKFVDKRPYADPEDAARKLLDRARVYRAERAVSDIHRRHEQGVP